MDQQPVTLGLPHENDGDLEPDITVLHRPEQDFVNGDASASDIVMCVEISYTTLTEDTTRKATIYAQNGIAVSILPLLRLFRRRFSDWNKFANGDRCFGTRQRRDFFLFGIDFDRMIAVCCWFTMNNDLIDKESAKLMELTKQANSSDLRAAVTFAYRTTLSRPPSGPELDRALTYLANDAAQVKGLAWVLFNLGEFIYVR